MGAEWVVRPQGGAGGGWRGGGGWGGQKRQSDDGRGLAGGGWGRGIGGKVIMVGADGFGGDAGTG